MHLPVLYSHAVSSETRQTTDIPFLNNAHHVNAINPEPTNVVYIYIYIYGAHSEARNLKSYIYIFYWGFCFLNRAFH
jgi:hypothetical protein